MSPPRAVRRTPGRKPEPTPERAAEELRTDLWRLRNDLKSALARWPYDNHLRQLARQVGVK